jgi:hypothetical protein
LSHLPATIANLVLSFTSALVALLVIVLLPEVPTCFRWISVGFLGVAAGPLISALPVLPDQIAHTLTRRPPVHYAKVDLVTYPGRSDGVVTEKATHVRI